MLNEDSLEELCGNINDDVIIEVVKMRNLRVPEGMREEYEEKAAGEADIKWGIRL